MAGRSYSIGKNRIQRGYYPGFELKEDGSIESIPEEITHALFIRPIDSAEADSAWGRLSFRAECGENTVYYVYAAALNEDSFYRSGELTRIETFLCSREEGSEIKKEFFERIGARRFANRSDILLYGLRGRHLYLMFEVLGTEECRISDIRADLEGDNFMNTFPEIYREYNGFFHRYLSIFSSIYEDFQGDINKLPKYLDLDECPADLLSDYGKWLGIDVGENFLEEDILRTLVKEAYSLNRMKGTRTVLERLTEIILGKKALVLERNMMADIIKKEDLEEYEHLYGNSVYDVTILLEEAIPEFKKSQLMFLLNQFKPVRARLHLIYLKKTGQLDSYSYLDMNARVSEVRDGSLDTGLDMETAVRLK